MDNILTPRPPMVHELKCWPEYYAAVQSGQKTFEIRKWDRPYREGDSLLLKEYDPKTMSYTGEETLRTISYILDLAYLPGDNIPHFANYVAIGFVSPDVNRLTAQLAAEKKYSERQSKESLKREIDIQGLYERISAVQAERDAAIRDLKWLSNEYKFCTTCKLDNGNGVWDCNDERCDAENHYEWRGICAENAPTGAEGEKQ